MGVRKTHTTKCARGDGRNVGGAAKYKTWTETGHVPSFVICLWCGSAAAKILQFRTGSGSSLHIQVASLVGKKPDIPLNLREGAQSVCCMHFSASLSKYFKLQFDAGAEGKRHQTMSATLIGLVGASGAGKTTSADKLVSSHGYTKFHIGTPLKGMLQALGLPAADLHASPQSRNKPHELLSGKSVRYALSTLGTEWGRDTIGESIWSTILEKRLERHFEGGGGAVVVDDLRFPSDWSAIKNLGGLLVCVRRADVEAKRSLYDNLYHRYGLKRLLPKKLASKFAVHETEFHWRDAPIDFEVQNDADPELVAQKIYKRASEIASNPAI